MSDKKFDVPPDHGPGLEDMAAVVRSLADPPAREQLEQMGVSLPPLAHPGPQEIAVLRMLDAERVRNYAIESAPLDSGPEAVAWIRGFLAAADILRNTALRAARGADEMSEHTLAVLRACNPVAMAISGDELKSYGSKFNQDAIAGIVAKALRVEREQLSWVTDPATGKLELWIAMPKRTGEPSPKPGA